MIPYKIEDILDGQEKIGFIFRFAEEYALLEEFFFGDVYNFPSLISKTIKEAMDGGEKTFAGNSCVLKVKGDETVIVPLFSDYDNLVLSTKDLYETIQAYREYKKSL